jgi:hypothetical protein
MRAKGDVDAALEHLMMCDREHRVADRAAECL